MYLGDTELRRDWVLGLYTEEQLAAVPEDRKRVSPGFEAIRKAFGFGPAMVRTPMTELLLQTLREIVNNALDRIVTDEACNSVTCRLNNGAIMVQNNGQGFPLTFVSVEGQEKHTIEAALFSARTSSNFGRGAAGGGGGGGSAGGSVPSSQEADGASSGAGDSEVVATSRSITGGMYGVGATLTAVWSNLFRVTSQSLDTDGSVVTQETGCEDNMEKVHPYTSKRRRLDAGKKPKDRSHLRTAVMWEPDWKRMGFASNPVSDSPAARGVLCRILCELFTGRSASLPAERRLQCRFDGVTWKGRTVQDWAWVTMGIRSKPKGCLHAGLPFAIPTRPRWLTTFVTVHPSDEELVREDGPTVPWRESPPQFGLVNAISCSQGTIRTHVESLVKDAIHQSASASSSAGGCSLDDARRAAWIGYVATVPNPQFSSQTKDRLLTPV